MADTVADNSRRIADARSDSVRLVGDSASDSARWMTFTELAAARGISRASASRLVRRRKWRRQSDNQGNVLILVPPEDSEQADSPMDIIRSLETTFREQIEAERSRADRAEAARDSERARADDLREHQDRLRAEVDSAKAELAKLRQADATRRGQGRWERLRAAWRGD
jgi:hypothetical protein